MARFDLVWCFFFSFLHTRIYTTLVDCITQECLHCSLLPFQSRGCLVSHLVDHDHDHGHHRHRHRRGEQCDWDHTSGCNPESVFALSMISSILARAPALATRVGLPVRHHPHPQQQHQQQQQQQRRLLDRSPICSRVGGNDTHTASRGRENETGTAIGSAAAVLAMALAVQGETNEHF